MKKMIIKRGILGFPLGIAIGYMITVMTSINIGDGLFYPVTEELIHAMSGELNAVIVQTCLCGVMGAGFGMASLIWEKDDWSLLKQSGIYFGVICVLMFPIAYVMHWMEHSLIGVISYLGIFVLIFIVVWIIQYYILKSRIKKINDQVNHNIK